MQKEHKNLELLFQGTLRENEKCMSDLERYAPSLFFVEKKNIDS